MSLFPYSSDARIESVLACTHCARSKAKCDRKVPCTRCVDRKLVCETRPPRRGHGHGHTRSSNHSCSDLKRKRPRSRGRHGTRMSVGSDTDSAFTFAGESHFSTQALLQAEDSYMDMDWTLLGDSSGYLHVPALPDPPITASFSSEIYPLCPDEGPGCYTLEDLLPGDFPFCPFPGMSSPTSYLPSLTDTDGSLSDLPYSMPTLTPVGASQDNILPLQAADIQPHEALDGWPIFKCNPIVPSRECTPTAAHHVNHLRTLLESCTEPIENSGLAESTSELAPLLATTRERLTAVLQGLFNEAQHVYSLRDLAIRTNTASRHSHPDFSAFGGSSILLLPPPLALESLLQSCLAACSPYYPFITTSSRTVSKRMESSRRPILPSIFLLLMLAAGAMTVGAGETHNQMAHGLVEICRISLRRQIEQDVQLALDPEVLECALLLTIVAVWSGDKWQMDISICQKAMFLEMHSQAGFQNRETQLARLKSAEDVAQCCQVWEENERKNRITYSWLILDHEICLSQDIPPTSYLSITNLDVPIPSGDITSGLKYTKRWMQGISHSSDHITLADQHDAPIPPPLNEYVRYFRETNDVRDIRHVSPTSLRLLLCYLQNTVAHLRCSVDRIPIPSKGERHRAVGQTSLVLLSVQFQEAQELLNKWYTLARTHFMSSSTDDCSPGSSPSLSMPDSDSRASSANMILYHLVMLNTMVSFPEIERMARIEPGSRIAKPGPAPWKHPYHLENTRDIYVQCGQVLRLVRSTPEPSRPVWWAGAVYRVALVAWANSLDNTADTKSQTHRETVILDDLPPDHPSILAYLDHQSELLPMFSDPSGALVSLHVPVDIIHHCARVLDSDMQTKFTMGIQQKMLNMAQRWGKAVF